MPKTLAEGFIAKISIGLLITMATGLVLGTRYVVTISNATDTHTMEITKLKQDQSAMMGMALDIAVIKQQLTDLNKKLDEDDAKFK